MRIAIIYNLKREKSLNSHVEFDDSDAEFESPETIEAIRVAIMDLGHEVILCEANQDLPSILAHANVDLVFNQAEGLNGNNREAQVPALLELMAIPFTGSGSKTMTITLDKYLAKKLVADAGVPTPSCFLAHEPIAHFDEIKFPLMVKPVAEGSSKGVWPTSVVDNEAALQSAIQKILFDYHQPALVEHYVSGREFTVAIFEDGELEVFPPMEIRFLGNEPYPVYSYSYKLALQEEVQFDTKPVLSKALRERLDDYARRSFRALGCKDVARIDFRMNSYNDEIYFLECNPLPGLSPGWSDISMITQACGITHQQLIHKILAPALKRVNKKTIRTNPSERLADRLL